jgi:hypothetical protein
MSDRSHMAVVQPIERIREVVDRLADLAPVVHLEAPPSSRIRSEMCRIESGLRGSMISYRADYQRAIEAGDHRAADEAFAHLAEATRLAANQLLELNRVSAVSDSTRAEAVRRLLHTQ